MTDKTTTGSDMKLEHTQRGFAVINFTDQYGVKCSLQASSLATEDAIWLGCNEPNVRIMASQASAHGIDAGDGTGWVPYPIPAGAIADTRMHLTRDHVKALLPVLQHFAETGEVAIMDRTTGSDAVDLLPCPFCGGTNIDPAEWSGNDGQSGPGCGDCGALAETARDWNRRVLIAQARAAAPTLPTDISKRLREYAANPGYSHNDYADTMRQAAEEIERYYGGMMNWKRTAEAKDREFAEARAAAPAAHECEDCSGTGCTGEVIPGDGMFQPPEPEMCGTCGGAGLIAAAPAATAQAPDFHTWWTMKAIEYQGRPFVSRREAAQEAWSAALSQQPVQAAGDDLAERQRENAEFTEWWVSSGQQAAHDLTTENAAHATWQERARRERNRAAPVIAAPTAPTCSTCKDEGAITTNGIEITACTDCQDIEDDDAAPTATSEPVAWIAYYDGIKSQNVARTAKEKADIEEIGRLMNSAARITWEALYAAPAPQQAAPLTDAPELLDLLRNVRPNFNSAGSRTESRYYEAVQARISRAIELLSAGSAASAGDARDGWSQKPPTEQGEYWHWNGDEDAAPYVYHIMWSGTAKKCFVSIGQYDITEAIFCDKFGGWWKKIDQPATPDRAAMAATKEKN